MSINFATLTISALSFTIALAWNDAISKMIQSIFPPTDERAIARTTLVYALLVTLFVIFIVAVISSTRKIVQKINGTSAAPESRPAPVVQLWDRQ